MERSKIPGRPDPQRAAAERRHIGLRRLCRRSAACARFLSRVSGGSSLRPRLFIGRRSAAASRVPTTAAAERRHIGLRRLCRRSAACARFLSRVSGGLRCTSPPAIHRTPLRRCKPRPHNAQPRSGDTSSSLGSHASPASTRPPPHSDFARRRHAICSRSGHTAGLRPTEGGRLIGSRPR